MKEPFGDLTLVLNREPDDFGLLNSPARCFTRRGHYKIRERAPFDFRGALQQSVEIAWQSRLKPGCSLSIFRHDSNYTANCRIAKEIVGRPILAAAAFSGGLSFGFQPAPSVRSSVFTPLVAPQL